MPFAAEADDLGATARIGRAWRELRRGPSTAVAIELLFGAHGEPGSIEPGQLDILDLLTLRDSRRMSDLATTLGVDPSTVTRALQRMEARGLASRSTAQDDGRVVTVQVTAEGRRLHAIVAARRTALLDRVLESFSPEEREALAALLDRFIAALDEHADEVGRDAEQAPG